jgi:hypothetical protein
VQQQQRPQQLPQQKRQRLPRQGKEQQSQQNQWLRRHQHLPKKTCLPGTPLDT